MTQVRIVVDVVICPDEQPAAPQAHGVPAIEDKRRASRDANAAKPSAGISAGSRSAVLSVAGDNNTIIVNLVMPVVDSKEDSRNSSGGGE